jgi:hypothetical protein
MNAHNLNQSGSRVEDKGLSPGDRAYFYKPPTQQEVARRGRKAKHLAHYHGPAIVRSQIQGRDRQYNIRYGGKHFKRDISMLIPERTFLTINVTRHDPTTSTPLQSEPELLKPGAKRQEEELAICKTDKGDKTWHLVEVHTIYPDEIEVIYYTTPREQLDGYETTAHKQK